MLEVRRTPAPLGESSELREMLEPVRDGGLEPLRDPGWVDWRRLVKPIMVSSAYPASTEALELIPRLLSDFSLILVMGPEVLGRCPDWLDTELLGLASALARDLNGVMA
jgi:hypothetical protein